MATTTVELRAQAIDAYMCDRTGSGYVRHGYLSCTVSVPERRTSTRTLHYRAVWRLHSKRCTEAEAAAYLAKAAHAETPSEIGRRNPAEISHVR